ncbi:MAG: hypothetical protein IK065_02665 [Neisseriaceae bacterium]|nr:hypothetical protein [Neisseriaceae bacterium]
MVRYDRNAFDKSPVKMRYGIIILPIHKVNYWILLKIFRVNSARKMNLIHIIACILLYIEMFFIFSSGDIELLYSLKYHLGTLLVEFIILLDIFYFLPYWIDDDIADICERPSDLFTKGDDLATAKQENYATNIAKQFAKNTGGKNTEITLNVANNLDLKNNTIVLTSKSQKPKTDDE